MSSELPTKLGFCAVLCLSGCALLGKSDALKPRYFSPDASIAPVQSGPPNRAIGAELRLGRITAASHLGERIAFRDSNYELNFYETRRWTEAPEAFLRRALAQSLFEAHGLRRIVSGAGPTLEAELTEFAEVKGMRPLARVRVTYLLYDNRLVRREATLVVELPIAASPPGQESPEATVRVLSDALSQAVGQIVDHVIAELGPPEDG